MVIRFENRNDIDRWIIINDIDINEVGFDIEIGKDYRLVDDESGYYLEII